jgi:hypothetical protein
MKRIFFYLLAAVGVTTLAACQVKQNETTQTDKSAMTDTTEIVADTVLDAVAETPAEVVAEATELAVDVVTEATVATNTVIDNAMPRIIIYKTKADYSNLVPLAMDNSKSKIVSFPDPRDVNAKKRPTHLANGYLLDNFGIGKNVVYTDYTYEAYMALEKVPSLDELKKHIIEYNPLTEYYRSENDLNRNKDLTIEALNGIIAGGCDGFTKIEL